MNCAHCGAEFEKYQRKIYCSKDCNCAAYRARNREALAKRDRARRLAEREKFRKRDRERYKREAEHRRAYARQYHYENRDAALERMRARREANPESHRERARLYYESNKSIYLEAARRRKKRMREAKVVDFSAAQLEARLSMFAGCWMCGTSAEEMHIDHVEPIVKGGPHMLSNLRPACAPCNLRKGAKWPYPEQREALDLAVAA